MRLAYRQHGKRVRDERDACDDDHDPAIDGVGVEQAADAFDQDPHGEREDHRRVGLRGQDGAAVPTERTPTRGRATGELHRVDGEPQPCDVGQVVRRIGQETERVGDEAEHDLHRHDHQVDGESEAQSVGPGV